MRFRTARQRSELRSLREAVADYHKMKRSSNVDEATHYDAINFVIGAAECVADAFKDDV